MKKLSTAAFMATLVLSLGAAQAANVKKDAPPAKAAAAKPAASAASAAAAKSAAKADAKPEAKKKEKKGGC